MCEQVDTHQCKVFDSAKKGEDHQAAAAAGEVVPPLRLQQTLPVTGQAGAVSPKDSSITGGGIGTAG